jgi:adenylate cyclase
MQGYTRNQLQNSLRIAFSRQLNDTRQRFSHRLDSTDSQDFSESEIVPISLYTYQEILRPLFGLGSPPSPCIGDHPDFIHLRETCTTEYCAITTMFMDIEGSTRLNLLYSPEQTFRIKNSFICAAIEIIKSFDGHVHRIMGDAVLAFFGGKTVPVEIAAIKAINCASVLRYFVDTVVIPMLSEGGFEDPFGIRIGLDHGPKEKVLWASYGYPGMQEVTATSFFVDVASKLQSAAPRNQIMLGESLRALLDLPEDVLKIKYVQSGGAEVPDPVLRPNYTDHTGKPINYKQYILKWEKILDLGPVIQKDGQLLASSFEAPGVLRVQAEICDHKGGSAIARCYPCSTLVPKGKHLKFSVHLPYAFECPYKVRYIVENHGIDAFNHCGSEHGNHQNSYTITKHPDNDVHTHWEEVIYRNPHKKWSELPH